MLTIQMIYCPSIISTALAKTIEYHFPDHNYIHRNTSDREGLNLKADLTIIDLEGLPDSIHLLNQLPERNVLLMIGQLNYPPLTELLQQNYAGYICKEIEQPELIRAVDIILSGQQYIHYPIASFLQKQFLQVTKPGATNRPKDLFSSREWGVLHLLTKGYSNQEIAKELYLSESTVKNYLSNLMKKLNVCNRTNVVLTAIKEGWFTVD